MKMDSSLISIFKEAIRSVKPAQLIRRNIEVNNMNRIRICENWLDGGRKFHIIGFGKAVYGMAVGLHKALHSRIKSGILSVPPGEYAAIGNIEIRPGAANNLPDEPSLATTDQILQLIKNIPTEDVVVVLISGGGSSLLCKPIPGVSLQEKLLTIKWLVSAGANIHELNTVRKTLSTVKGGGLAKALQGRTAISLILSDVIGDSLDVIASGPTVPNTAASAAIEVIQKFKLELKVPRNVLSAIKNAAEIDFRTENLSNHVIGNNITALKAAQQTQELPNIPKFCISSKVDGLVDRIAEAYVSLSLAILQLLQDTQVAAFHAKLRHWLRTNDSWGISESCFNGLAEACQQNSEGILLVFGGEPTVEVKGAGLGGRSQQLSLIFSKMCHEARVGHADLFKGWDAMLLSGGTDGIDGPTDAAGAIGCAHVFEQGRMLNIDPDEHLNNNNSYAYFARLRNGRFHIKTGYTGTNVMDLHLLLIYRIKS